MSFSEFANLKLPEQHDTGNVREDLVDNFTKIDRELHNRRIEYVEAMVRVNQVAKSSSIDPQVSLALIDANGNVKSTLKERLDADYNEVIGMGEYEFAYDEDGNVSSITTDAKTVSFQYTNGELEKVVEVKDGVTIESTFTFDLNGVLTNVKKEVV